MTLEGNLSFQSANPEAEVLWRPDRTEQDRANIASFMSWLQVDRKISVGADYQSLWKWSVADVPRFWALLAEYFGVLPGAEDMPEKLVGEMPDARWFPGAQLNLAEKILSRADEFPNDVAVVSRSEVGSGSELTWSELRALVGSLASYLRELGIKEGDCVVSYMPNIPETLVAFLASASIGAIWSSCSLEFAAGAVVDRFSQLKPKVLFAADGYYFGGRRFNRLAEVQEVRDLSPTLVATVLVNYIGSDRADAASCVPWERAISGRAIAEFAEVAFEHPLWVLYSSGTTGIPKGIVHGHGGVALQTLAGVGLNLDLRPSDRFFWFTTTSWVMWNILVASLLLGNSIVLYDGSPTWPGPESLWSLTEKTSITRLGVSGAYIRACSQKRLRPKIDFDLSQCRGVTYTGSPIAPEDFRWVYESVSESAWFSSISGGTELCGAIVGGSILLPVTAGEFQCRCLGVASECLNEAGDSVTGEVGELVISKPMPSMPLYLWNDPDGQRYRATYFTKFPGRWCHGDWIKFFADGRSIIYGRSDATINRNGVRIGTAEIYGCVESISGIKDSLVVDLSTIDRGLVVLFVVLDSGYELNEKLKAEVRDHIRSATSPRHVPDEIVEITEVPVTLNGKKLEVPVQRILKGYSRAKSINVENVANPNALDEIAAMAPMFVNEPLRSVERD